MPNIIWDYGQVFQYAARILIGIVIALESLESKKIIEKFVSYN